MKTLLFVFALLISTQSFSAHKICSLKVLERSQSPAEIRGLLKCSSKSDQVEVLNRCLANPVVKRLAMECVKTILDRGYKVERVNSLLSSNGQIVAHYIFSFSTN